MYVRSNFTNLVVDMCSTSGMFAVLLTSSGGGTLVSVASTESQNSRERCLGPPLAITP